MIQPGKLKLIPHHEEIPYSVVQANSNHESFMRAASFDAESVGVRVLEGVGPDKIALGFFRTMLEHGGTNKDMDWLIKWDIVEQSANSLWNLAVADYATRGME